MMKKEKLETNNFLALVFQTCVCIVKRKNSDFSRVYRDLHRSPPTGAEGFFLAAQPELYFLESATLTPSAAYGRMLAWTRYWKARGFTPVSPTVLRGLETAHPDDALHDSAVSDRNFADIYQPANNLAADISLSGTDPRIHLIISKDEFPRLRKSAADVSMTVHDYCTAKIFDRPLPNPSLSELYGCLSQLRRSCTLLDNATKYMLLTGKSEDIQSLCSLATSLDEEIRQLRQLITTL